MKRIRDLLVEAAIALIFVVGLLVYASTLPAESKIDPRPFALVINTITVFGFVAWWFRDTRKSMAFWVALMAFLVAHIAVYHFIVGKLEVFPGIYYIILDSAEWTLILPVLSRLDSRKEHHL